DTETNGEHRERQRKIEKTARASVAESECLSGLFGLSLSLGHLSFLFFTTAALPAHPPWPLRSRFRSRRSAPPRHFPRGGTARGSVARWGCPTARRAARSGSRSRRRRRSPRAGRRGWYSSPADRAAVPTPGPRCWSRRRTASDRG